MNEKKVIFCCDQLTEMKGVYDVETKRESYFLLCKVCNQMQVITTIREDKKTPPKLPRNSPEIYKAVKPYKKEFSQT